MIGRGVESKSGGSVFPLRGCSRVRKKAPTTFPRSRGGWRYPRKPEGRQNRNGTSRGSETAREKERKKERKGETGRNTREGEREGETGDIFPPSGFGGRAKTWRGMRATFLLFIVSRCLCFTRPCRAVPRYTITPRQGVESLREPIT